MIRSWLALVLPAALAACDSSGVRATITNSGADPLKDVRVVVSGDASSLGTIAPGASAEAVVDPTSESHIVIEYDGGTGQPVSLDVDSYLEPGYGGSIAIEIAGGSVVKVDDRVESTPYR